MGIRVGIDTGGTFTDLVAVDESSGRVVRRQGAVDPGDPVAAVAAALEQAQFDRRGRLVRRRRDDDRDQRGADPHAARASST